MLVKPELKSTDSRTWYANEYPTYGVHESVLPLEARAKAKLGFRLSFFPIRNCADAEIEVLIGTCESSNAFTSGGTSFDCTKEIGSCKKSCCNAGDKSSNSDASFFTSDGLRRSCSKPTVMLPLLIRNVTLSRSANSSSELNCNGSCTEPTVNWAALEI